MTRPQLLTLIAALLVAACGEREQASEVVDTTAEVNPEPIVVYASYENDAYLPKMFEGFTEDTGIRVTVRNAEQQKNVDDVIAKRGSPPADLLLTSLIGVWRAADEGALRPLGSDAINKSVSEFMRDPDGFWTAISLRPVHIAFDTQHFSRSEIGGVEDLAKPEFKGKLCLTSSAREVNRLLIAKLIQSLGERSAEIIVRGWVSNLALPSFSSEVELMRAMEAGTCAVGMVSYSELRRSVANEGAERIGAKAIVPVHGSVEAAGINRHAREPKAARLLLEWMLSRQVQADHVTRIVASPVIVEAYEDEASIAEFVGGKYLGAAAWLDEDAAKLAERAAYR